MGDTQLFLVGVAGLEPATSRTPCVRATNCATPRKVVLLTKPTLAPN